MCKAFPEEYKGAPTSRGAFFSYTQTLYAKATALIVNCTLPIAYWFLDQDYYLIRISHISLHEKKLCYIFMSATQGNDLNPICNNSNASILQCN
jgi:hypothetical protein